MKPWVPLRDVVQNHAVEMLAFVLMEIPKDADVISYPAARANASTP